jgi:hypothetical protein
MWHIIIRKLLGYRLVFYSPLDAVARSLSLFEWGNDNMYIHTPWKHSIWEDYCHYTLHVSKGRHITNQVWENNIITVAAIHGNLTLLGKYGNPPFNDLECDAIARNGHAAWNILSSFDLDINVVGICYGAAFVGDIHLINAVIDTHGIPTTATRCHSIARAALRGHIEVIKLFYHQYPSLTLQTIYDCDVDIIQLSVHSGSSHVLEWVRNVEPEYLSTYITDVYTCHTALKNSLINGNYDFLFRALDFGFRWKNSKFIYQYGSKHIIEKIFQVKFSDIIWNWEGAIEILAHRGEASTIRLLLNNDNMVTVFRGALRGSISRQPNDEHIEIMNMCKKISPTTLGRKVKTELILAGNFNNVIEWIYQNSKWCSVKFDMLKYFTYSTEIGNLSMLQWCCTKYNPPPYDLMRIADLAICHGYHNIFDHLFHIYHDTMMSYQGNIQKSWTLWMSIYHIEYETSPKYLTTE